MVNRRKLAARRPFGMATLYDYFRSSAAFRVRIALRLKGLAYESVPIHLVRDGGEQHKAEFRRLNPAGLVPVWSDREGVFSQSLAILEYLEETQPEPPLLPRLPAERAWVRSLCLSVACDIHPLNNLRVHGYLERELGANETQRKAWYAHWVESGLGAIESMLEARAQAGSGPFAFGTSPGMADCCLVPQVTNARRFACDLSHVPRVVAIHEHCMSLPAFAAAAPDAQPQP
jgi:maleylacetoacetate isomerase